MNRHHLVALVGPCFWHCFLCLWMCAVREQVDTPPGRPGERPWWYSGFQKAPTASVGGSSAPASPVALCFLNTNKTLVLYQRMRLESWQTGSGVRSSPGCAAWLITLISLSTSTRLYELLSWSGTGNCSRSRRSWFIPSHRRGTWINCKWVALMKMHINQYNVTQMVKDMDTWVKLKENKRSEIEIEAET